MQQIWGKRITIGSHIRTFEKMFPGNTNPSISALCVCTVEDAKDSVNVFFSGRLGPVLDKWFTEGKGKSGEPIEDVTVWLSPVVGDKSYNGYTLLDSDIVPDDYDIPQSELKKIQEETKARMAEKDGVMPI
ncbi:MAG: hypothetical protein C5B59_13655 [Bacteroidetes bacterium]|nr:MAG: hypothetical protein C5B59_13655 [Bacteroidota bacterium]